MDHLYFIRLADKLVNEDANTSAPWYDFFQEYNTVLSPYLLRALRTTPLGQNVSTIINRARFGCLSGDFGGLLADKLSPIIWDVMLYVLPIILTLLTLYYLCKLKVFSRISQIEPAIASFIKNTAELIGISWLVSQLILILLLVLTTCVNGLILMVVITYHMMGFPKRLYVWLRDCIFKVMIPRYWWAVNHCVRRKDWKGSKVEWLARFTKKTVQIFCSELFIVIVGDGVEKDEV